MNASLTAALRSMTGLARPQLQDPAAIIEKALADAGLSGLSGLSGRMPATGPTRQGLGQTLRGLRARTSMPGRVTVEVPEGASFLARTVTCAAGSRPFRLYVPAHLPEGPRPLIVMLHGCTQNPEDFAVGTGMNKLAERHGFLVAYPEQPRQANAMACWNWFEPAHQRTAAGEPAILAALIDAVAEERPVDRARVFAAGLSAGGAMAAILGEAYPDRFAAVAVHSGLPVGVAHDMSSAMAAMRSSNGRAPRPAPIGRAQSRCIVLHGDADATVNPGHGDAIVQGARAGLGRPSGEVANGASAGGRAYTRSVTRDDEGRAVLEQWVIHGAGHAWAGGAAAGSYTDPTGPDASAEIVRFFLDPTS